MTPSNCRAPHTATSGALPLPSPKSRIAPPADPQQLIADNRPIVIAVIRSVRFRSPCLDSEDLEQIANLSLVRLAAEWDPDRASFQAFAARALKNDLLSSIRPFERRPVFATLDTQDDDETGLYARLAKGGKTPYTQAEIADEAAFFLSQLSPRDRQIIRKLAAGKTHAEIGRTCKPRLSKDRVHWAIDRLRKKANALRESRAAIPK